MPNPVMLDNRIHKNVRIDTSRGAEFGENVHFVPVIADELPSLVLDYPVCLMKDGDTGRFGLQALTGFEPGENLFLDGDRWNASYVPLHVRRQPFLVGFPSNGDKRAAPKDAVISIDMDSTRVQETHGESLFDDDGIRTPFLESIYALLDQLMTGIESTEAMINEIAERDLVEPIQLNVTFDDGETMNYGGLYTVNDEKLQALNTESLANLHGKGYLQASYLLLASVGHIRKLIDRKNALRNSTSSA